jgi:hypothetical protein
MNNADSSGPASAATWIVKSAFAGARRGPSVASAEGATRQPRKVRRRMRTHIWSSAGSLLRSAHESSAERPTRRWSTEPHAESWQFVKLDERILPRAWLMASSWRRPLGLDGRCEVAVRLGGVNRGLRLHERDSYDDRAGFVDSVRKVRPRGRVRCRGREKRANAITWSRPSFLSSPRGTTWVPSLTLLSLLALSTMLSRLRRTHDELGQHCGPPPPRLPNPLRPRAHKTRPRCCRRGEVEEAMILVTRDDPLGAFIRRFNCARRHPALGVVRASRSLQAEVVRSPPPAPASRSASSGIPSAMRANHRYYPCVRPSCASRLQALTRIAASQASIQATFSNKTYVSQGTPRYPKLHHALEVLRQRAPPRRALHARGRLALADATLSTSYKSSSRKQGKIISPTVPGCAARFPRSPPSLSAGFIPVPPLAPCSAARRRMWT